MVLFRIFCIAGFIAAVAGWAGAQHTIYTYRNFSFKDGLATPSIRAMDQDATGFIWAGGDNGLYRYDGHRFEAFQSPIDKTDTLIGSFIVDLTYDPYHHYLWIASLTDIQYLDLNTYRFYRPASNHPWPATLKASEYRSLLVWSKDQIWFTSGTELFELRPDADSWQIKPLPLKLSEHVDRQRIVLDRLNPDMAMLVFKNALAVVTSDHQVSSLHLAKPGEIFHKGEYDPQRKCIYIAAHRRLVIWNPALDQRKEFEFPYSTPKHVQLFHFIHEVSHLDHNTLILSGMSGHILFDLESFQHQYFPQVQGEFENNMSAFTHFTDREGNLWRGSLSQFVNGLYFQNHSWKSWGPILNEDGINVEPYKTREWNHRYLIFSGSGFNGLGVIDKLSDSIRLQRQSFTSTIRVHDIAVVNPELALSCDGQHIYAWDARNFSSRIFYANTAQGMIPVPATDLLCRDDHLLAYGHDKFYDIRLPDQTIVNTFTLPNSPEDHQQGIQAYVTLLQFKGGKAYFSKGASMYVYTPSSQKIERFLFPAREGHHRTPANVIEMEIDSLGQIWLASLTNGLFCYQPQSRELLHYTARNSRLESNYISELTLDRDGRLWIGSASGIYLMDVQTHEILTTYSTSQGITNTGYDLQYHPDLHWITLNTYPRIARLDLNSFPFNDQTQPPVVTSLQVSGVTLNKVPITSDTQWVLQPSENDLAISFTNLSLNNSDQNQFRYQMTGVDTQWVTTHDRKVLFSRLPAGNYVFRLQASNNEGRWDPRILTLKLRILPVFYATWWFITLVSLACALLIGLLYRLRLRQIRAEEKIKRAYDKKISEIEMKALRAQMNPHFIFNALNSIQKFIFEKDEYAASQYLTKFSRLIRLILDQSHQEFITIQSEIDLLSHYLDLERLRFSQHFSYQIMLDPQVHSSWLIPSMVIQPHVENAIWHGLMHKEEEGKLDIRFSTTSQGALQVTIEDNGIGRAKANELRSKQVLKKKSYGSTLSSDRLKSFDQWQHTASSLHIEDLFGVDGEASGTRVTILLPIMDQKDIPVHE